MKEKMIIVSGYFNPLHKGHIEYFHTAKSFGDFLIVIVNNDHQRNLKKAKEFMLEDERCIIVQELSIVDKVLLSVDLDRTVIKSLQKIHEAYSNKFDLYFANGGDQDNESIPEKNICNVLGIKLIDGLGSKIQSSSWLKK